MEKKVISHRHVGGYSYNGGHLDSTDVAIEVYDKNCGSGSCIEITIEESWTTEKGRSMNRTVSQDIPREKLLELKKALNEMDFDEPVVPKVVVKEKENGSRFHEISNNAYIVLSRYNVKKLLKKIPAQRDKFYGENKDAECKVFEAIRLIVTDNGEIQIGSNF